MTSGLYSEEGFEIYVLFNLQLLLIIQNRPSFLFFSSQFSWFAVHKYCDVLMRPVYTHRPPNVEEIHNVHHWDHTRDTRGLVTRTTRDGINNFSSCALLSAWKPIHLCVFPLLFLIDYHPALLFFRLANFKIIHYVSKFSKQELVFVNSICISTSVIRFVVFGNQVSFHTN